MVGIWIVDSVVLLAVHRIQHSLELPRHLAPVLLRGLGTLFLVRIAMLLAPLCLYAGLTHSPGKRSWQYLLFLLRVYLVCYVVGMIQISSVNVLNMRDYKLALQFNQAVPRHPIHYPRNYHGPRLHK